MKNTLVFSKKKSICPCGKSTSFHSFVDYPLAGKCHAMKCGQRFFPPPVTRQAPSHTAPTPPTIRHHIYQCANSEPHMRITVKKFANGDKNVFAERWSANGWSKGIEGIVRLPYRLPEVLERVALSGTITIVEGEKDADTAAKIGITATCNPFGAGKWSDEMSSIFVEARVVIIPDNDPPGHEHARFVQASLLAAGAKSAEILDWLRQGRREVVDATSVRRHLGDNSRGQL